jgi:cyclomaltodextrinase
MKRTNFHTIFAVLAAIFVSAATIFADRAPYNSVHMAGTFNDWNTTDPAYAMTYAGDGRYRITRFFRAGQHQFKFVMNGSWDTHLGAEPDGRLGQPGENIQLSIPANGGYSIELRLKERRFSMQPVPLPAPQALLKLRGDAEINTPVVLDASESLARAGRIIRQFAFWQDENDPIRVELLQRGAQSPTATARFSEEGDYHFWLRIFDGVWSAPEKLRVRVSPSYQLLGALTADDPANPVTSLRRLNDAEYVLPIRTERAGTNALRVVKNRTAEEMVAEHTFVSPPKPQQWLVIFDAAAKKIAVSTDELVEFSFTPRGMRVVAVHLAGTFNNWDSSAIELTDRGDGTYTTTIRLPEGYHEYKFVVNGDTWLEDPRADVALRNPDGHGGHNSGLFIGERGDHYGRPRPNHINFAALRHDPESAQYFNVVSGEMVEVRFRALANDLAEAELHFRGGNAERRVPMTRRQLRFGFDEYTATVFLDEPADKLAYYFVLRDGTVAAYFGGAGEAMQLADVRPFESALEPRFPTPDWAKHVVWYQIFPERFRNGTTENDPPKTVPWTWDWYKPYQWERMVPGKRFSTDWYDRRFGGDFQGLLEKLPYLKDLGITAIYFNPVFQNTSNHGYDARDYRHIHDNFGFKGDWFGVYTNETLDPATWQWTPSDLLFLKFVREAHAHNIKVVIDGVFNHVGKAHWAFVDVMQNGKNSPYADWFDVTDWGPPVKYRSWDGGGWLPNFKKNPATGLPDPVREHVFHITRRWMAPVVDGERVPGVDGWRLDVPQDVPSPFWRDWRKVVKAANPDGYISGEIWGPAQPYLRGDQFDAVMNYQFAIRAIRFFIDKRNKISASEFDRQLHELLAMYPMQVNFVMQNLYDSHDTDRLASMVINPDRPYDGANRIQDSGPNYIDVKPGAEAYNVVKLMTTFQMCFVGAPMIYYGNEVGMWGADDPTNRKPMLWKDLQPYENPQDFVMDDVLEHFKRVIAIRKKYTALRTGLFSTVLTDDERDVYAFARTRGREIIVCVFNNASEQTVSLPVSWPDGTEISDVLGGGGKITVRGGKISLKIPRKSAAILVAE